MQKVYLDNQTTTRPSPAAVQAMLPFLHERWGVPSMPHTMGQELTAAIEGSYRDIKLLLGAQADDVFVFTSSGAEAVNHVIMGVYLDISRHTGKNHYIVATTDEAPAIMAMQRLETMRCTTTLAPVNKGGVISIETLTEAITPRTALISLSWGNALTGVIQPIEEIATLCRERGILLHVDATQALTSLHPLRSTAQPDFLTFNGDHLHAPKGTGGLLIRSGFQLSPLIMGGSDQGGWRGGSLNTPALVALGKAAREALEHRDLMGTEVARLRGRLEQGVLDAYPKAQVLFEGEERLPHITAIALPGIASELFLYSLHRRGVYASFGGSHHQQIALALKGAGVKGELAQSSISFGLSRYTTDEEIDLAIERIAEATGHLKHYAEAL